MRLSNLLRERQSLHNEPGIALSRDSDDCGETEDRFGGRFDPMVGEGAYLSMKSAKQSIGLSRIRMGAVLCILEETGAWRGKTGAKSFNRFLVEEGIEPKAARQYMAVGKTFVLGLECAGHQLEQLARGSMRALVEASRVATADNLSEVIEIVAFMPRPEAIESLKELAGFVADNVTSADGKKTSRPVGSILDKVGDLTLDQRAELYERLRVGTEKHGRRAGNVVNLHREQA